jgi:hypothetical protein
MSGEFKLDGYNFRARLAPILIVILPAVLGIAVWIPVESDTWKMLGSIGMSSALAILLMHLGRDLGKGKQQTLFASWGGKPTTRMLRHRDSRIDPHTKERYHGKLQALLPAVKLPSSRAEKGNPDAADLIYESCVKHLLEVARDKKKFALVYEANVAYGFRRNFWGMKPAGIANATLGLISSSANGVFTYLKSEHVSGAAAGSIAVCALLLTWWLLRITPMWVQLAGDDYAERLLAVCETLEIPSSSS